MTNFRSGFLDQGQPLGQTTRVVNLTADNQTVLLQNCSRIDLVSDNTTAANRTFTIENSTLDGYELTLVLISGSSTTCQLADSGNAKLASVWEPLQDDMITLRWVASRSAWIEEARGKATGGAAFNTVYAAEHTTVGGSATEAITVTGVLASDLVLTQLAVAGAVPRTILTAATTANTVTVVFSGDPAADHVVTYQVLRAAT